MIQKNDQYVLLSTAKTSLLFHINEVRKVTCEYYGRKIVSIDEAESLTRKYPYIQGCSVSYDEKNPSFCLDHMKLIASTMGKSDFFSPSLILSNEDTSIFDFVFDSAEIREVSPLTILPFPHGGGEEVIIHLKEEQLNVLADIHYVLFEDSDVIAIYTEIRNNNEKTLTLHKVMSSQLPLVNHDYEVWSTYGTWAGELNIQKQPVTSGRFVIESLSGTSSCRHNPFFLIKRKEATFEAGEVYGFNLMYSSDFENSVEMDAFSDIRIQCGISSTLFAKKLNQNELFVTPVALMVRSDSGINAMSQQYHHFINHHVIPVNFENKDRPVSYNNWEATMFSFNKRKIVSLMKKASAIGAELFVLDDGWFSTRNDDRHGLGDWEVNEKKIPGGLDSLAKEAKKLGMKFGIWMEPEMVNDDTKTYKEHPDWIIHDSVHTPSKGRNQYVLDLSKKEVQDFVYESVSKTLKSGEISYVKWDYNRDITDFDNRNGSYFYDYMIGLYSVLDRLVKEFPDVLFENCASGGNRFDLGMLSYFAQSWMSDDTDSYQRTLIQEGGLLGYPMSVMSNHVSAKTSNQMLRWTTLDNKFDTACFGVLGYELDLDDQFALDRELIKAQIQYYKDHRHTFQWGDAYTDTTYIDHEHKMLEVKDENEALVAVYSKIQKPNPTETHLRCYGLETETLYSYETRQESIPFKKFGNLLNMVSPIHINPEGTLPIILGKYKDMKTEVDKGIASGSAFESDGPVLAQEWSGVGYDERIRMMSDFGARLYLIQKQK